MRNEFIVVENLQKEYLTRSGERILALENITLSIAENEFITVVGKSGCGKSTLLKIIAGIVPFSKGGVSIDGVAVNGPRKGVGMVFQNSVLLPWRSVWDNIMFPIQIMRRPIREYEKKANHLIGLAGLAGFENKMPRELSGGMQQRVSICRALVFDPTILLMDEPFGALDAMTREELGQELTHICQTERKTVLFVTHSISEAVFLADRVIVMSRRPGRVAKIVQVGLARPRSLDMQFTQTFKGYASEIRETIYSGS